LQYEKNLDLKSKINICWNRQKTHHATIAIQRAAAIAESAGVKHLVYTHIIPSVGTGMKDFS
jgi:ribonuclease BN (tRNA processing enzyme)